MPTTPYGASDFRQALVISGVPVVVGAVSGRGLLDVVDHRVLEGESEQDVARTRSLMVESGVFALATEGDITVDGLPYKVVAFEQLDDGLPTKVAIASVV